MVMKLYLIVGIIVAAYVLWGYTMDEEPYTIAELFFGAILDVLTWPIVLLVHYIINRSR